MGAAAADYDNDGHPDLFVAGLKHNTLYHNRGNGVFEDVTAKAGIHDEPWSVAAGWFGYDGDGLLDVFVGQLRGLEFRSRTRVQRPAVRLRDLAGGGLETEPQAVEDLCAGWSVSSIGISVKGNQRGHQLVEQDLPLGGVIARALGCPHERVRRSGHRFTRAPHPHRIGICDPVAPAGQSGIDV